MIYDLFAFKEEEAEKQRNMENEHRKKGRRKREIEQESLSPESSDDIERDYKGVSFLRG